MNRRKNDREWPGASDEAMREHVSERTGRPDEDPGTMQERGDAQDETSERDDERAGKRADP